MRRLLEVLNLSVDYLKQKGVENSRREAQDLICDALRLTRTQLYLEHEKPLTDTELDLIRSRLVRRGQGEPLAYIHGEVKFYGCSVKINPNVLIPRHETEILVDKVVQIIKREGAEGKTLWDVCCGSGYVGIALKKTFPELQVSLSDISPEALAMAQENAALNHVQVDILQGDLLAPFAGNRASYVVCNPPYISEEEYSSLDKEVRDYEPRLALVSGQSGIEFYRRLANELPPYLEPKAKVGMEIGQSQGKKVLELFPSPPWKEKRIEKDWGGHDRFFFLEIE